jgi:hypothetical protein
MITLEQVKQILESNGVAYPYARKGCIAINGGRLQKATKPAIDYARAYYKAKRVA